MAFRHPQKMASSTSLKSLLRHPERRLWVLKSIHLLKSSLKGLRPNRFYRFPGRRKWVRMSSRHLESSLHRLHKSRFLRRLDGRLWVVWAICLLKTSLKQIRPSLFFWCRRCKKWVRMAFRHFEILFHWLHQILFLRRPEVRLCVHRAIRLLKSSL
jgi:hypothetical protein